MRGPTKNNRDVLPTDDMTTSGHQVTSPVDNFLSKNTENFLSKNCDSVLSQAESLFNALTSSSSFSKPFPPSKGVAASSSVTTSRYKSSEVNNRTRVTTEPAKLSCLSTRKFFKSEKKLDSTRVRIKKNYFSVRKYKVNLNRRY